MFKISLLYCLPLCLFALDAPNHLPRLTVAEADAIILAREVSKAERKAAHIAKLEEAPVKSEGRGVLPNGQEVIIREVFPPADVDSLVKVVKPAIEPAVVATPTPEFLAKLQANAEKEGSSRISVIAVFA